MTATGPAGPDARRDVAATDATGGPPAEPGRRRPAISLRLRLVVLVILAAIPALGLALYTGLEQRSLAAADAQATARRVARIASAEQQRLVADTHRLLQLLAQVTPLGEGDADACNTLYQSLLADYPQYTNFAVANRAGDFICSGTPLTTPVNVADRKYFQGAMATHRFALGDYVMGRVSGKATLLTGLPVLDADGNPRLVFHAGIDLTWLNRFAAEADLPPGARLAVIDRHGLVLVRYPDPQTWVGQSVQWVVPAADAAGGFNGVGEAPDEAGIDRLFAFAPLGSAGQTDAVYISVGTPSAVAYGEADAILRRNLIALGLVTLLTLLAAWFGSDLVALRRIRALVAASGRLASGDLTVRSGVSGAGELDELARAFDAMAVAVEERRRQRDRAAGERDRLLVAVGHERATLAAIIASMSQGLIVVDADGHCRYSNGIADQLLGLASVALYDQPVAETFAAIADGNRAGASLLDAWPARSDGAEPAPSFVFRPAGQAARDLLFEVFPVRDAGGTVLGSGALLRDVTAELDLARTKDELVAVVSHELRTPLAAVVGFAELLLTRELPLEKRQAYLKVMVEEGQRLSSLINDLLDIQRMEGEGIDLDLEPTDPRALIEQAVAVMPVDPAHPTIVEAADRPPRLPLDRHRCQQVLTNLISNARKYSPAGGPIRLALAVTGETVEVGVTDSGLGLPPEELPRLFQKFYRVDNSDRRSIKGVGLGLAICRRIVEAHGGRIWAESAGLGRGSCFRFSLPLAPVLTADRHATEAAGPDLANAAAG